MPLIMLSTWLNFGEIFSEFFRKILKPFSLVELSICHILGMLGPIDVKQKGNESTGCYADKGSFDLDLWPWIFKVKLYLVNGRRKTPEANIFTLHMVDLWVWENFWHPSRWPWVKVTKLTKRDAIYLVPTIKWEPLIQLLQNLVGISPSSCFPPD